MKRKWCQFGSGNGVSSEAEMVSVRFSPQRNRENEQGGNTRTTKVYFVHKEEDAEVAARRIQIRLVGRQVEETLSVPQ
jgi:hypothetical protein